MPQLGAFDLLPRRVRSVVTTWCVCLSVVRSYILKTTHDRAFLLLLLALSSSGGVAIC